MAYTITGRLEATIRSRSAYSAKQAVSTMKEMRKGGFDVLSITDSGNHPLTVDALLEKAASEGPIYDDGGELAP